MKEVIAHLIDWYQTTLASGGYPLIAALMAMESTIAPLPSECIIPFAAQRAHATGALNMWGIVLAGTLGSWIGATIMYWASRLAGRPLVLRYGGYFLVPEAKLHAAERWAARFGPFGVFVARLLPGIWCSVLVWVGVAAGNDPALLKGDMRRVTLWLFGAVVVLSLLYYFLVHRFMARPVKEQSQI
jgi:membrane protein DedA with SNARE-associated domain